MNQRSIKIKTQLEKIKLVKNNSEEVFIHPSLRLWYISFSVFICFLLIKLLFTYNLQHFETIWRIALITGLTYFGYSLVSHLTTSYSLNALEIVGKSGVFSKKVIRIPLNRITNYECRSSFIERLLSLNNIMLDTPGGSGYELTLSKLDQHDSELIVERLRYLMGQQKIADAGSNEKLIYLRKQALG